MFCTTRLGESCARHLVKLQTALDREHGEVPLAEQLCVAFMPGVCHTKSLVMPTRFVHFSGYLKAVWLDVFVRHHLALDLVCGVDFSCKFMCGAGPGDLGRSQGSGPAEISGKTGTKISSQTAFRYPVFC